MEDRQRFLPRGHPLVGHGLLRGADRRGRHARRRQPGHHLIDPSVTRRLIARFTRSIRPAAPVPEIAAKLTVREIDVLRRIARGLSNTEIAAELVIEESAVKTHVGRVLTKLDLRDRVQAVIRAQTAAMGR